MCLTYYNLLLEDLCLSYSVREKDKRTDMLELSVAVSDCHARAASIRHTLCDLDSKLLTVSIVNKVVTHNPLVVTNKNITRDPSVVTPTKT
jgi:hypothetical protein